MENEVIKNIQIYCNVHKDGSIKDVLTGERVHPGGPFSFFFLETQEVADNITDYKVVIVDMETKLELKSAE